MRSESCSGLCDAAHGCEAVPPSQPTHTSIAPWHPAMFGFDYPHQSQWPYNTTGSQINWNGGVAKVPLREKDKRPESYWVGNGMREYPPSEGVFLELESGGVLTRELCGGGAKGGLWRGVPFV